MLNSTFSGLFNSVSGITLGSFLLCLGAALVMGVLVALTSTFRSRYTRSFVVTLALLPAITAVVIMMVSGNLGVGVAVAGTFSLVRFRSAQGTAREIGFLFMAVAVGLACGMGYPGFALLFTLILCLVSLLLTVVGFGGRKQESLCRVLKITVPEDLDYTGAFTDILEQYTANVDLLRIKTVNLGSMNRLTYAVTLRQPGTEKAMIDALRCRNGNLEISLAADPEDDRAL